MLRVAIETPLEDYREVRYFRRGRHHTTAEVREWLGLRRRKVDVEHARDERIGRNTGEMQRPVDFAAEHGSRGNDATQFAILGWICVVYGGFFLAMMLIPNSLTGRACYGFMALANLAVGALFIRNGRRSSAASQQQALS